MPSPTYPAPQGGNSADRACLSSPVGAEFLPVAALYVQAEGCYFDLPGVDPWDEERDARLYDGPHPVVAHPPCHRWGKMARVNYARWGGEHNRPGNDGGCFKAALAAVRTFGGVLEHPALTYAFAEHGLPRPKGIGWHETPCGGWVCEVWQSAYGHRANKGTWLYFVGPERPPELDWSRPIGSHQIGFQDRRGKARNKPTLSKREANATPVAFREALIALARSAYNLAGDSSHRVGKLDGGVISHAPAVQTIAALGAQARDDLSNQITNSSRVIHAATDSYERQ